MNLKNIDWKTTFFTFNGRVGRKVFWTYLGIIFVFFLLLGTLGLMFGDTESKDPPFFVSAIILITIVPLGWASLAVQIKRWHDMNRSGWFVLISLIPVLGFLINIVCQGFVKGTEGPNRFGDAPQTITF